jgi:cytochrome P450
MNSFLKESQRLHPIGISLGAKKMIQPGGWTFSNGDHIPCGATVVVPTLPLQRDEDIYSNADEFQGFRFAKGDKSAVSDSRTGFLAFGYGRHSWSVLRYRPCSLTSFN